MGTELTIPADVSVEYQEAVQLHKEIMANAAVAASALLEMSKGLKRMRDGKLYAQLGFDSFDVYVEQMTGFKKRQAYNYISVYEKHGERFLCEHADLGVTKLNLLAQLPFEEREAMVEENDLAGMSVSQIRELVDKNKGYEEQVTLLQTERDAAKNQLEGLEKLRDQLEELRAENDELRAAAENTEPDVDKMERVRLETLEEVRVEFQRELEEAESEAEKAQLLQEEVCKLVAENKRLKEIPLPAAEPSAAEIQRLAAEAKEKAEVEADKRIKKVREDAEKHVATAAQEAREAAQKEFEEKYSGMVESLRAEKAAAAERFVTLEKKAAASTEPEMMRFNFYFEAAQMNLGQMKATLDKLREVDSPNVDKIVSAMRKFVEILPGKLGIA